MPARLVSGPDLVARRRSLLWEPAGDLWILDQTQLPHEFRVCRLPDARAVEEAIREMRVRGAPLIGVTAAYGLALVARSGGGAPAVQAAARTLAAARPTAINLEWALQRVLTAVGATTSDAAAAATAEAQAIDAEEVERSRRMGEHGLRLLLEGLGAEAKSGRPLRLLTHCNTGWLATVGSGTALAVVYEARARELGVHVWVDETRPRAQGAKLTAWELQQAAVPCTLLADTAAGRLLQTGQVDAVLVGCDRATARGDVCNKVGTYPLALAARDNGVPFYAVLPASSVDWTMEDAKAIPVETRDGAEVTEVTGRDAEGRLRTVRVPPAGVAAINFAFDVTPARLLSGLVTEHGVYPASAEGMARLRAAEMAGLGS